MQLYVSVRNPGAEIIKHCTHTSQLKAHLNRQVTSCADNEDEENELQGMTLPNQTSQIRCAKHVNTP